ncbi:MAG: hypothetical protein GY870_09505 [archaeon]|nr:hypothetical protein [archaeon]
MNGWVKMHRQICDNPLWTAEKFSKGQAWVDLILLANHTQGYIMVRGVKIDIKRGQVGWSEVRLSERWQWSRNKTRNFLKLLEKEQQIEQQKNNVSLIISIVNYDRYQSTEQQTVQQKDSRRTAEGQQKDTNKNVKKEKNVKKRKSDYLFPENYSEKLKDKFNDFILNRKELKKPVTEKAFAGLVNKLEKLSKGNEEISIEILNESIINGWSGIFKTKTIGKSTPEEEWKTAL